MKDYLNMIKRVCRGMEWRDLVQQQAEKVHYVLTKEGLQSNNTTRTLELVNYELDYVTFRPNNHHDTQKREELILIRSVTWKHNARRAKLRQPHIAQIQSLGGARFLCPPKPNLAAPSGSLLLEQNQESENKTKG